ncbi:YhcH/YjgK/YiaL family protein [Pleomorphovibrio marinus]|uniref:YhcH/YjgK/YiaL family protein n=1 Tax=Pleomorphovibrio marinus TaxID=2164132 RepID=UPI000E0B539D|nr:YhcH/YjgK/YiaL family protein [Pleomorphovibrio marinus]
MILDNLSAGKKYAGMHVNFPKAFAYLTETDLDSLEAGFYEISGKDVVATVFTKPSKTKEESLEKFECHDKHIDIQVCLHGEEAIGWKPRETCKQLKGSYNPEKDVSYYADEPDTYFQLSPGQFAIFFPEDVHAPMIGKGDIKKLVIKVKI